MKYSIIIHKKIEFTNIIFEQEGTCILYYTCTVHVSVFDSTQSLT